MRPKGFVLLEALPWGAVGASGSNGAFLSHRATSSHPFNVRPPLDSVQLVNITPISMVYGTYTLW